MRMNRVTAVAAILLLAWLGCAALAQDGSPRVAHVGAVRGDVLAVAVEHGRVTVRGQEPYVPQPGDAIDDHNQLTRDGEVVGVVCGPDRKTMWLADQFADPQPPDLAALADPSQWTIRTASGDSLAVRSVARRSEPTDHAQVRPWQHAFPMRHTLYLQLDQPLTPGTRYAVAWRGNVGVAADFDFNPDVARSEAVHVSHAGFAPGDGKTAFLSAWQGDGGPISYPDGLPFRVVEVASGRTAFSGKAVAGHRRGTPETERGTDYTGADVYVLAFDALDAPGAYRVVVDGIGCSYPFRIDADVYREPMRLSAKGLFNHRSGIALAPPMASFTRPRPMHPADGSPVFQARTRSAEPGGAENGQDGIFKRLQREPKDVEVDFAWGGWMDAGDWDRHVGHLVASRYILELAELYPAYVTSVKLNIPEAGNAIPDLVDEALWNVDCWRRTQRDDGGVSGWIEMTEHPLMGETSWTNSLANFVTAPDVVSSFAYAATAAQAATALRAFKQATLADAYRDSAIRAYAYADLRYDAEGWSKAGMGRNERVLASVMLYREAGDARYHDVYLANTALRDPAAPVWAYEHQDEREAAFVYARLKGVRPVDDAIVANCVNATLREARDWGERGVSRSAFQWASNPWGWFGWGHITSPATWSNVRAYHLTGDRSQLDVVRRSVQFALGANPQNRSYLTGFGPNPARHPLHVDTRMTGQPAPEGITVYGPLAPEKSKDDWILKRLDGRIHPDRLAWPAAESYFDVTWIVPQNEYTVWQTIAPNLYLFGVLDAESSKAASR
jgi:endoglucanase